MDRTACSHLLVNPHRIAPLLTLTACLLVLTSCGPAPVHSSLEALTSAQDDERFAWTATAAQGAGAHRVWVALENNPAKLLGWSRNDRTYKALVDIRVTAPGGEVSESTVTLPITELQTIGKSADGSTEFLSPVTAGTPIENGMFLGTALPSVSFRPSPGDWLLEATVRAPPNSDRRGLRVIRAVHLEVRSRARTSKALTGWQPSAPPPLTPAQP